MPGNKVLDRLVEQAADDVRVRRAEEQVVALRRYAEARYGAKSWRCERRVAARIEATTKGLDIHFVVTNITGGGAESLYDTLYCVRGQTENLIKLHKSQLASGRPHQLPLRARQPGPSRSAHRRVLADVGSARCDPSAVRRWRAEWITVWMGLIKIGARIAETASRVRIAFAAQSEAALFANLARCLQPAGP